MLHNYCNGKTLRLNQRTFTIFQSNWYKAMEYCHYLGLRLVTVVNLDAQMAIVKAIESTDKGNGTTFWTGGNDLGDDENYHWYSTGTRITWFNWNDNPNDRYSKKQGNCVQLILKTDSNEWRWNTAECRHNKYFVCERV